MVFMWATRYALQARVRDRPGACSPIKYTNEVKILDFIPDIIIPGRNEYGVGIVAGMKINHRNASLRICVDRKEKGSQISGRIYSPCLAEPIFFTDMANLLLQMEAVFDRLDFPRAFQRKRTFGKNKPISPGFPAEEEYMNEELVSKMHGEVATFVICVTSRQNTTWQGWIDWLDNSPRQQFRSALELIRLTDRFIASQSLKYNGDT